MPPRTLPAESQLLLPVLRGLIRLSWADQMTPAAIEVPWHQKRVDVALAADAGVLAVELKVSHWRRAIDQAYVNRWASSASWVGLWHECITPQTYDYAQKAGVGLLVVTANTVYPLTAAAPCPRPTASDQLAEHVHASGNRVRDLLGTARGRQVALA